MAYVEFDGKLDGDKSSAGFVPFTGQLDKPKGVIGRIADALTNPNGQIAESGAVDPMTGIDPTGGQAIADPDPQGLGIMADATVNPNFRKQTSPLRPEVAQAIENQYDAATPEQRVEMLKHPSAAGDVVRRRDAQFVQMDGHAPLDATDMLDPRAEARARQLAKEGMAPELAGPWGAEGARRGELPGTEVGQISKTDFDFDTQKKYNDDPFFKNPLVRGAIKGYEGFKQGYIGVDQFIADTVGADEAAAGFKKMAQESTGFTAAMGEPKNYAQNMFEGAINSIAQQLPALLGGALTGSEPAVLSAMFVQSFGQNYSEGRALGQDIGDATTRASQMAALEVIGEKFGLGHQMASIKAAAKGNVDAAVRLMAKASLREVPGEEVTTVGQFLVDKEGGNVGLHTEAGVADLITQMRDTVVQTVIQGGLMTGGAKVGAHAINLTFNTPERQIARAIANTSLVDNTNEVARALLDPQNRNPNTISPTQTVRPAAPSMAETASAIQSATSVDEAISAAAAGVSAPIAPAVSATLSDQQQSIADLEAQAGLSSAAPTAGARPSEAPSSQPSTPGYEPTAMQLAMQQAKRKLLLTPLSQRAANAPDSTPETPQEPSNAPTYRALHDSIPLDPVAPATPFQSGAAPGRVPDAQPAQGGATNTASSGPIAGRDTAAGGTAGEQQSALTSPVDGEPAAAKWKMPPAAEKAEKPKQEPVLSIGLMPNAAEPITVKNGVVHIGQYPAQNFDTGEDVTVPHGASPAQIRDALVQAGAVGRRQRIFGVGQESAAEKTHQTPSAPVSGMQGEVARIKEQVAKPVAQTREQRHADAIKEYEGLTSKELRAIANSKTQPAFRRNAANDILQTRDQVNRLNRSNAMKKVYAKTKGIDPDRDTMAQAIAKLGGINRDSAAGRLRLAPEELNRRGHGVLHMFHANGKSMDEIGQQLAELGYVEKDEHGKHDQTDFEDKLAESAGGADVFTPSAMMIRAADDHAQAMEEVGANSPEVYDEVEQYADTVPDDVQAAIDAAFDSPGEQEALSDEEIDALFGGPAKSGQIPQGDSTGTADASGQGNQAPRETPQGTNQQVEPGRDNFGLQGQTEAEARAQAATAEQQRIATEAEDRRAAEAERQAGISKEIDSRQNASADNFQLGQSAEDALAGQRDIFAQPDTPAEKPAAEMSVQDHLRAAAQKMDDAANQPQGRMQAAAKAKPETALPEQDRIDDFGEKIIGAKKELWATYRHQMAAELPADAQDITLSKHFPEPNYEAMIADGADVRVLAAIKAMRDEIPSKPRMAYKLRRWGDQVKALHAFAGKLLDGTLTIDHVLSEMRNGSLSKFADRIETYAALGYPAFKHAGGYEVSDGWQMPGKPGKTQFAIEKSGRHLGMFDTREAAIDALRARLQNEPEGTGRSIKLDLYRVTKTGEIVIGKKVGSGKYIDLKGGFASARDAREYLAANEADLLKLLEQKKEVRPERRSTNDPRVGKDYRQGENVTPEKFAATFGFRGVQFGNYVEQAKRAHDLNNAYDALLDLASTIGVPERAISLNGTLGLAFGARGRGGKGAAAAHYEAENVVVNLTKNNGAGSLAHEWWHALDNYFGGQRGKPGEFVTDAPTVRKVRGPGNSLIDDASIRPDVLKAYEGVVKSILASDMVKRSRELDSRRTSEYWSTVTEMTARAFESYIIDKAHERGESNDYLANIVSEDAHKVIDEALGSNEPFPYPTKAEAQTINAAFDKLFKTLQTKETDKGTALFYRPGTNPVDFAVKSGIIPKVTFGGTAPFRTKSEASMHRLRNKMDNAESVATDGGWSIAPKAGPLTNAEQQEARTDVAALNKALKAAGVPQVLPLLNVPSANHELARRLGKIFGTRVQFVTNNGAFDGVAHNGIAYLTKDLKRPELAIAGHEVFHTLEQSNPQMAEDLLDHVRGYLQEGVIEARQQWETVQSGEDISERYAAGEVMADLNGAMWLDPKFWREMLDRDTNLFRRVAYLFMEKMTKAVESLTGTRFDVNALVTDADAVRKLIAQTWVDHIQQRDTAAADETGAKFSRTEPAPIFYSALARTVPDMSKIADKNGMVSAEQARLWLMSRQKEGKFKADELAWSGLDDYLKMQTGKVAIADIEAFVRDNGVQVREVMKGAPKSKGEYTDADRQAAKEYFQVRGFDEMPIEEQNAYVDDMVERGQQAKNAVNTKYEKYTLPGGENYRELLLTLPKVDDVRQAKLDRINAKFDALPPAGERTPAQEKLVLDLTAEHNAIADAPNSGDFHHVNHWSEPNIIAHIRFNERTDADGKRVLFIEELQSDWGQQGKKKGFSDKRTEWPVEFSNGDVAYYKTEAEARRIAEANGGTVTSAQSVTGIPAAPFVTDTKTWLALGIKRMVRYAAENGFDKVAFINGEQAADRFDLSKQIQNVQATKTLQGAYHIKAVDNNGSVVLDDVYGADGLPDVIGKDLAEKVVAEADKAQAATLIETLPDDYQISLDRQTDAENPYTIIPPGQSHGRPFAGRHASEKEAVDAALARINRERNRTATFSGLDLKVGGDGMKAFYDKIVPQVANDVLKKVGGGKVGEVNMITDNALTRGMNYSGPELTLVRLRERQIEMVDNLPSAVLRQMTEVGMAMDTNGLSFRQAMEAYASPAAAKALGGAMENRQATANPQPGFDITPAMRESVMQGQPLFSRKEITEADNALKALSETDPLFKLPKSKEKEVEDIAHDNIPGVEIRKLTNIPGETRFNFTFSDGKTARLMVRYHNPYGNTIYGYDMVDGEMTAQVDERPGRNTEAVDGKDDVFIDVSLLKEGSGFGGRLYNIAATYAYNNGKVFIGDPAGLSDEALRRRSEQMLSSALKFGTTRHLAPHPRQVKGDKDLGVPPLDWVYGDHIGNIEKLIDVNLANIESSGGIGGIAYNIANGSFTDSDGNELTRDDLSGLAQSGLGRQAHAGGTTIGRAAVLGALRDAIAADNRNDAGTDRTGRVANGRADAQTGAGRQPGPRDAGMSAGEGSTSGNPVSQESNRSVPAAGQNGVGLLERLVLVASQFPASVNELFYSRKDAVKTVWDSPEPSKIDDFVHVMQDKHIDTKRVVQAIRTKIGEINDHWNPYLQEELFHGRSAKQVGDFLGNELRPLLQDMQARGIPMQDFEEYLHMRHAEERNNQIAKVNPDMPDGGSGVDTAAARAYLSGLADNKKRAYESLAKRVDAINKATRQILIDSGLEKPETIKAWEGAYQYYVPLQRDEGGSGIGQGFSVKGGASKRAMGSKRAVVNILANLAMQRERTIVRAEKNRVSTALYGLAITSPNPGFWQPVNPDKIDSSKAAELVNLGLNPLDVKNLIDEPKQQYIDQRTGLVAERINPFLRSAPNVISTRVNGEDRYVFFNENDDRAVRMVRTLKNLDADQLGRLLSMSAKVTRYFSSINTQYNPIFGMINLIRDSQEAMFNLTTTPIAGKQKEVLAYTLSALRGIYIDLRDHRAGKDTTSKWAAEFEEFQKEGGQTGYRNMFSNSQERADALKKELKAISEGKLKAAGRAIFDWLSDYNETMENSVRLAAYKVAKDQGLSKQQAASVAKNLTVNFNRKGQITTQAGALYAFFNAAVQGTARMAETLRGPAGKKIIAGGLLLGSMQALLLAAAGFGDDEPPEFIKSRNFVIPIGDGKYLTWPMPLGLKIIPTISRLMTEFALGGFKNPGKKLALLLDAFADTFNPIGNAGLSMQTITPTALDPLAALAENKDWTGKKIAREDRNALAPTPGYTRTKDTASEFSKILSYYINLGSGGTKYKPGMLSPTPDQLDYLIGQATGGAGREAMKVEQTAMSQITGEDLPTYKIPIVGRFYGDMKEPASVAGKFYSNLQELNQHEAEIKGLRKDKGDVAAYVRENPESLLFQAANNAERDILKLNHKKREMVQRGASKDAIKLVEQQTNNRMASFNDRVHTFVEKQKEKQAH